MPGIKVEISPPFRTTKGKFTKAEKAVLDDKRKMMRQLGRSWVEFAQDEAPKGKTGKFAKGIRYKTFIRGTMVEIRTYSPQPLGKWIAHGTKAHPIVAKRAKALRFYWPKGGSSAGLTGDVGMVALGAVRYFKRVWHPGTKANPYHKRATKRWRPGAYKQLRQVALNYKTRVTK